MFCKSSKFSSFSLPSASNQFSFVFICITLREESNVEKSPAEQNNAELKNANLVQNSHSFIPHFSGILDHSYSFIPGILDHSQSFIPHFLNSRLHFFQCIFLPFKEI